MNKHERMIIKKLMQLKEKRLINVQQYRTFKGQVVSGDITGAIKGVNKLVRR